MFSKYIPDYALSPLQEMSNYQIPMSNEIPIPNVQWVYFEFGHWSLVWHLDFDIGHWIKKLFLFTT